MPDVVVAPTKPWWQSKVVWFNILCAVGVVLEVKYEALKPLVSPQTYNWLALIIPAGNTALRVITTASLTLGQVKS